MNMNTDHFLKLYIFPKTKNITILDSEEDHFESVELGIAKTYKHHFYRCYSIQEVVEHLLNDEFTASEVIFDAHDSQTFYLWNVYIRHDKIYELAWYGCQEEFKDDKDEDDDKEFFIGLTD